MKSPGQTTPPAFALLVDGGQTLLPLHRSLLVGSASWAELRFEAPGIASEHARIQVEGKTLRVDQMPVSADPPITVAGRSVTHTRLVAGERLTFGADTEVEFVLADPKLVAMLMAPETPALPAVRRFKEPTFSEMMADELARAPWLLLSIAAHAAVFLLLLLFANSPTEGERSDRTFRLDASAQLHNGDQPRLSDDADVLPEPVHVPESDPAANEAALQAELQDDTDWSLSENPTVALKPDPGYGDRLAPRAGRKDILHGATAAITGNGFGTAVAERRATGLDVVFVFDSTGSMGSVLDRAKSGISRSLEALSALVPDTRIGIVTFRDSNADEEYVVRDVPLAADPYRAVNFLDTVQAGGGGDEPEAVLEGLRRAFDAPWREGAHRVIVLVGDAPEKPGTLKELLKQVRRFSRDRASKVHTIATPANHGGIEGTTKATFAKIARAGGGAALQLSEIREIVRHMVDLVFGGNFAQNLAEVDRLVEARRRQDGRAARSDGLATVRRARWLAALRRQPIDAAAITGLQQDSDLRTVHALVDLAADATAEETSRQAAAFLLKRLLRLGDPPVNPDIGGAIDRGTARGLRQRATRMIGRRDATAPSLPTRVR